MVDMGLEFNPTKLIESAANLWGDIQSLAEQNQTNRTSEVRFGSNQFRTSEVRFGLDDDTKTKLPWWLVGVGTAAAATFGSSMRVTDGELSDHIKGILQDALAEHNIGDFRGAAEEYARAISAGEEKGVDPLYIIEWLIREGHEMAYAHAKDQRDIVADGKGVSPYMGAYARAIRMLRGYASQDVVSNVKRLLEDGNIDQAEAVAARFINTIEGLNSLIAQPWRGDGALTTGIPSIIQNLGGELTHQKGQYVNVLSDLKELITKENHVRELVKEGKLDQALNILRQLPLDYDQMELKRSLVRAMRTAATVKFKKGDFSGAYNDAMDARIDFKNGDLEHVQSMVLQARAQIERLKELSKPKVGEDVVRDAQKQYKEQLRVTLNAVITDINQKFGAQTESVSGPYREALAEAYELQARYEILFGDFKLAGGYLDKAEFFNRPSKIIEPIRREFRQLHKIKNSRLPSWAPAFVHKFIGEGEVAAIKYERAARKDEAKAMRISRVLSSAHFPAPVGVSQVRGISVSTDYNNRDAESRFYTRTARRLEKAAKANWRGENPVHGAELFYEAILNYELASNYDEAIRLATSVAELARKANHNSFASEMDAEVRILKEAAKSPIRGEVAMASAYDLIAINLGEIRDFEATAAIYRKNSILSRRLGSSEEGVSYLINAARSELARNNFLAAAAYVAEAKEIAERNDLPVDSLVSLKGKIEEKFGGKIDIAGSLIDRLENKIRGDRTIQSAEDMLKVRNTTPNMLGILRRAAASYLLANEPELRYQALMRYGQFAEPEEAQAKYLEAADIIRQHRLWGKGDPQKLLMMELEALYARAYSLAKLNNPNAKPKAPAITNGPHFDVIIANNKRRTEVRNMYEDVRLWIRDYKGDVLIPQAIGDSALAVEIRNTLSAAAGMSTGLTPEAALELTKVVREDFEKGADGRAEIPVAGTDPAAESPRVEVGVVGRPELPKDVMIRGNEGEPQRMVRFREKFGRAIDAFLQSKDPEQLKMALNIMRRHPELGGAGLTETHLLDALEGRYPELAARLESWCWKGFSRFPGDNVARVIREVQQGQKGKVGRRDGRDRDRPHPIGK